MTVTMKDIAELAGVSRPAVSAVLNRKSNCRVSEEKRRQIMALAQRMDYRPNLVAKSLVKQRTNMIGFVCGGISEPFFAELTEALLDEAETCGYRVMSLITRWNPEKELERLNLLLDSGVDGVIMFGSALTPGLREYRKLKESRFPLVLLESNAPDFTSIRFDLALGIDTLFERLYRTGHRRLALAYSRIEPDIKREAYLNGARKYGFELREYPFPYDVNHPSGNRAALTECLDAITSATSLPDALMLFSDSLATAMISLLSQRGIRVPEDLSVTGMDGTYMGSINHPPLTTIRKDRVRLARLAVGELLAQIGKAADYHPRKILVPTTLVEGESIQCRNLGHH